MVLIFTKGDIDRARRLGEQAITLDRKDPSLYVLLYNILAGAGRHEEAAQIRNRMRREAHKKVKLTKPSRISRNVMPLARIALNSTPLPEMSCL